MSAFGNPMGMGGMPPMAPPSSASVLVGLIEQVMGAVGVASDMLEGGGAPPMPPGLDPMMGGMPPEMGMPPGMDPMMDPAMMGAPPGMGPGPEMGMDPMMGAPLPPGPEMAELPPVSNPGNDIDLDMLGASFGEGAAPPVPDGGII